jgi:hypothetical protein
MLLPGQESKFDGDPSVPAADVQRAVNLLAANPKVRECSRIPDVKLLEFVGRDAVYLRTDHVIVDRMNGDGLNGDNHFPPDGIKLLVGGRCRVGGHRQWQDLTLLKIDGAKAVFHRVGSLRNGDRFEEVIAVVPYRDARWTTDPQDPNRITYTEFDEKGTKRIEKGYRNERLDGAYTTWYADGRKESAYHYKHDWRDGTWTEWHPNGQKRHEVTYRDDVPVGRELWWDAQGREAAIGEHPPPAPRTNDTSK